MTAWIRFARLPKDKRSDVGADVGIGRLDGDRVDVYRGDLFMAPTPANERLALADVAILTPCVPSKMIALWNNYRALAAEKNLAHPRTPLYLFKPPNTWLAHGRTIYHPRGYDGKVFYEGELGIVIGAEIANASVADAAGAIFGYTCINDVTAFDLLHEYPGFDQWSRAKGFDGFGVFGPAVASGLDYRDLEITTLIDGEVVQRYAAADMILAPDEVVAMLSHNMTLLPGDVICCGTSVGLGAMPPGCRVEVVIEGIGCLTNTYKHL